MARPRKQIDAQEVFRLAKQGCTQSEIAGHFGCAQSTISGRFRLEFELGAAQSKTSLRAKQFARAMKGSDKMLIHLGMVYLGQAAKVDLSSKDGSMTPRTVFEIHSNGRGPINGDIARTSLPSTNGSDPVSHNGS